MAKKTPIKIRSCSRPNTPHYVVVPPEIREAYPDKYPAQKRFFEKKRPAEMFCEELREVERRGNSLAFGLTDSQRHEAAECFALLSPKGRTLREAVENFIRQLDVAAGSILLPALVEEVVAAKKADGFTDKYIATFRSRLGIFAREHTEVLASEISTPILEDWLRKRCPTEAVTRNNYRRDLRTMFSYALAHRYVTGNPVAAVAKAKESQTEIEALSVDQLHRLLHQSDAVILPIVAIGAFAGLRPEEIKRLHWNEVDFEHAEIRVRAAKSKTGAQRFVKLSDNALAWLAPFRGRTGAIVPHDPRTRFENTQARAGIPEWPHDALRHSFASYHLAFHEDSPALALQMGHTGTELIFRHYRKVVTKRDAEAYWKIYPEGPLPT